jgi:hypothetical protein
MVMMRFGSRFVAGSAVAKIMAVKNASLFEQTDGAIDSGNRNAWINRRGARVERLDIGMVVGFGKDARNHLALLSDPQTFFVAQSLDINRAAHAEMWRGWIIRPP